MWEITLKTPIGGDKAYWKSVCNESTSLRVKRERKFHFIQGNHQSNIPNKNIASIIFP